MVCLLVTGCRSIQKQAYIHRVNPDVIRMQTPWQEEKPPAAVAGEGEEEEDADGAAEFYRSRRMLGEGDIPYDKYFAAQEHIRRMPVHVTERRELKINSNRLSLGSWVQLGPGNIGGITRALAIHPADPNIMYAGTPNGGIWKTTDGGANWKIASDSLPSLSVITIALDPVNPDVIYAGTGNYFQSVRGAGMLKSTDAGATWTLLKNTSITDMRYINKILVSPNDSSRIYAATWTGVWLSRDGGETWRVMLSRYSPNNGCQDITIRTDQSTDYVFAACGTTIGTPAVFRNSDAAGEGKWTSVLSVPNQGRTVIALAPSNQGIVYALLSSNESGDWHYGLLGVYRSTANGDPDTWEARVKNTDANPANTVLLSNPSNFFSDVCSEGKSSFLNQGFHDMALAVDPLDPDKVWVGGIDLFRSDDGGANWGVASYWWASKSVPQFSHADHHVLLFHPNYDGGANQTLFDTNDGGIYKTENAREATASGDRAFCSPREGGGKIAWKGLNNNYAVTQFYYGQPYPGGNAYLAGAQDNGTIRGLDAAGFLNWANVIGGDGGFVAIDPQNPNIVYGETTRLNFRKSTDGGRTFRTSTRGITEASNNFLFIAPFIMDPNDHNTLWIGGKTLWLTRDAAANWTSASVAITDGSISAIAVAPGNPNRVLAATSTGAIYRSDYALDADGNSEWSVSKPRNGYVAWIAFDPKNQDIVYAAYSTFKASAGDAHVYRSTDGGTTWDALDGAGQTALPDIATNAILADPNTPATLYAGTDLGVFISLDAGASWQKEDTGFPNTAVYALAFEQGTNSLYAFTFGRGAWRVRLGGDPCTYAVDPPVLKLNAVGTRASLNLMAADSCAWSVVPGSAPVALDGPATGTGASVLGFTASPNLSLTRNTGNVYIADKEIPAEQEPAVAASRNDERATAFPLPKIPMLALLDTRAFTENAADPVHSCTNSKDLKTAWFSFTATYTGPARVTSTLYRLDAQGTLANVLTAYPATGTDELACNTVKPNGGGAALDLSVTAGVTYIVEVSTTAPSTAGGLVALGVFDPR